MKAYLHTFGCRANQYDTEVVRQMIESAGGEVVGSAAEADVAVLNSCAVTAAAEADLRQLVRRNQGARAEPLRTIVMGCASARDDGRIAALPGVSDVIAGADLDAVAMALGLAPFPATARCGAQTGSRALLRVQDGCDEHCTFCATTLARGASRSRPAGEIVDEAQRLAEQHPEIVITGVHIGSYGADCGSSLGALMERLVREVPVVRFRLTSIEATEVCARLSDLPTGHPRPVAPHPHRPPASGPDRVLRRMGRHWYSAASYAAAVERLVALRAPFALSADIICGFPGETDADHAETVSLARQLPFTALHVFPFSARPGTPAERLGDAVPAATARARAAELREIAAERTAAHTRSRIGGVADVVVVGSGAVRTGLTEDYLSVALADSTVPRRARFTARLAAGPDQRLVAAATQ